LRFQAQPVKARSGLKNKACRAFFIEFEFTGLQDIEYPTSGQSNANMEFNIKRE